MANRNMVLKCIKGGMGRPGKYTGDLQESEGQVSGTGHDCP